jgi:hypothetical protein
MEKLKAKKEMKKVHKKKMDDKMKVEKKKEISHVSLKRINDYGKKKK